MPVKNAMLLRLRRQEGVSMVEFALVAPLLFVLLFGIIEFGIILYDQAVITNASRDGARYLTQFPANSSAPPTDADVTTYVQTYVANRVISFSPSAPVPTVSFPAAQAGYSAVEVAYPYQFLVFGGLISLLHGVVPNQLQLTATTAMQNENTPLN